MTKEGAKIGTQLKRLWGFLRHSDPEYFQDWLYVECPEEVVYPKRLDSIWACNLRYSPSTGQVQLLDIDGWCDPMSPEEASRKYEIPPEQQERRTQAIRQYAMSQTKGVD